MQFGEDANRSRRDHSAANLGLIRRSALNLLCHDNDPKTAKMSLKRRKFRALMVPDYQNLSSLAITSSMVHSVIALISEEISLDISFGRC